MNKAIEKQSQKEKSIEEFPQSGNSHFRICRFFMLCQERFSKHIRCYYFEIILILISSARAGCFGNEENFLNYFRDSSLRASEVHDQCVDILGVKDKINCSRTSNSWLSNKATLIFSFVPFILRSQRQYTFSNAPCCTHFAEHVWK